MSCNKLQKTFDNEKNLRKTIEYGLSSSENSLCLRNRTIPLNNELTSGKKLRQHSSLRTTISVVRSKPRTIKNFFDDSDDDSEKMTDISMNVDDDKGDSDLISVNKNSNTVTLLQNYMNQFDWKDLDFQCNCFKNLMQLLSSNNYSSHIIRYLANQIERDYGIFPPLTSNLYPICRFDSNSEPHFEFYFQSSNSPLNVIESLKNVKFEILNQSKIIYAFVLDYKQKHER